MNILLLGNMSDAQTGTYVFKSALELEHEVKYLDIRAIVEDMGFSKAQKYILDTLELMNMKPDVIIVFKGLELSYGTLCEIKEKFNDSKLANWFFDVYLGEKPIYETNEYFDTLKLYDFFFCSLKGVATELNNKGFKNVYYLAEACHPRFNGEQPLNYFQEIKYGSDVSFIGSLGFSLQHPYRIPLLNLIDLEGFELKIWGEVVSDWKHIPTDLRKCHMNTSVINDKHSLVSQCSLINIGIDQNPDLELSQSARMFRVMCAGGLYLTTHVKNLENMFNINKENEKITGEEDLVVFYTPEDLIIKIDFLLEHDDIRNKIRLNGQRKVLKEHTFVHRLIEMEKVIKNE